MQTKIKYLVIVIAFLITGIALAGCNSRFETAAGSEGPKPSSQSSGLVPTNGLTQSSNEGAVTIDVQWAEADGSSLSFEVTMNTHSVDLDGYDLKELAVLRDGQDNEYHPAEWNAASGGHHRNGTLTFVLSVPLNQLQTDRVELVIRGVAGVTERVLAWEL